MIKIDPSSLINYYNLLQNYSSSDEAKKLVLDLCEGSTSLDADSLKIAMSAVIENHNSDICDQRISRVR